MWKSVPAGTRYFISASLPEQMERCHNTVLPLDTMENFPRNTRSRPKDRGDAMTEPKYLIWSNYSLDYEDWRIEDLEAEYPELSEQEREEKMYERNGRYLDDERMNLDIQLDKPILVIVDLGRWNGRYSGYKGNQEAATSRTACILRCDYSDPGMLTKLGDMRCDAVHHDGTNHYLYRTYKNGVSNAQIENLKRENLSRHRNKGGYYAHNPPAGR